MELILLRHAEAEDSPNDFERKLTPKGKKDAKKVCEFLLKELPKDFRVLSSPLVRAKETVAYLLKDIEVVSELEPTSSPVEFIKLIQTFKEDEVIVASGHQPLIGAIAGKILGVNESLKTKKAQFWWFKGGSVRELELFALIPSSLIKSL